MMTSSMSSTFLLRLLPSRSIVWIVLVPPRVSAGLLLREHCLREHCSWSYALALALLLACSCSYSLLLALALIPACLLLLYYLLTRVLIRTCLLLLYCLLTLALTCEASNASISLCVRACVRERRGREGEGLGEREI